jgi:hypothetical protein
VIPPTFEIQPLKDGEPATARATCGTCGRSWDDGKTTAYTPAPSGRCPFEAFHGDDFWGDPIHVYTRADALADGSLVDLTGPLSKEAGIRYPVACTAAVFQRCIGNPPACEDVTGRTWDVLFMLRIAIRGCHGNTDRLSYKLTVSGEEIELLSICGPDDEGKPCITIMFVGEE